MNAVDISKAVSRPRVIALGAFDGVHFAHRAVLSAAVEAAKGRSIPSAVFTFYSDPSFLLGSPQKLLNEPKERLTRIAQTGIDEVICAEFDRKMSETEPADFYQLIKDKLSPVCIVCGHNFTFGRLGRGDTLLLSRLCEKDGISLRVVDEILLDNVPVSSSAIRNLISDGNFDGANRLLGYEYSLTGSVTKGNSLGARLGFPTANIALPKNRAIPPYGVYITRVTVDGGEYPAVTDIGIKPTVGTDEPVLESHIIGFNGDLYGKEIRVSFIKFIRNEMKFNSVEELSEQVRADIAETESYFNE